MLTITLNKEDAIAILHPSDALSVKDFEQAAKAIDPFLEEQGKLNGIIIYTESFPGWESFSSLISHLKFINNHQKKVAHLAFVTNSVVGSLSEKIGNHFVEAEVRTFPFNALQEAKDWILGK